MKHTYKDFMTGKEHYTRAPFVGWTMGGSLNMRYAIFRRRSGDLLIPEYLLTDETKNEIGFYEIAKAFNAMAEATN